MGTVGFIGGKFLPLHLGHVHAITRAACLCDELYVVLSYSQARDRKLCEKAGIQIMPYEVRLRWLSGLAKDMENVHLLAVEDTAETDEAYDWAAGAADIRRQIGKPIDFVFSSETSYEPIFQQLYPEARHIILDAERKQVPISATRIREEGIFTHWEHIPAIVRPTFVKKVVVVGTESCGKSTLTRYLAKLYNTVFVEEYGRTVCEEVGGCETILTEEFYPHIAYGHKMKEYEAIKQANKVLFVDTEAVVTQFYSELYTGRTFSVLDQVAKEQQYDLWLYMEPDVPWVDDGLRVHGENLVRHENNEKLKRMLRERHIAYVSIAGSYHERLQQATDHVDALLQKPSQ
ncbi:multifunctional transcriptional regulator/nicotinamide-nucleotide adenylyltransferase/ribosylnicotinamide kinase NadR [Brevibacillus nitrificans]|uniref:multifunctional transcriptional regulator/nicotinamide-nucleotide adenylyltransferase/ribosylnicotinamide kinase NadR n=1 Tax=Brevibacillus nitrificans TaxID=651560 RepID=UPI002616067E|nr:multifunctional transcriptional regulator/nicotinamide-nucleotide adenylyltransferase/ribosylnicotinamide kinase NadR [Brevibacillus nitrificans]MED1793103.1 multifunctional transcriptional regulator/nicotinamide-nucleotide adenylyltransferase/ribosylnicotinamide kinase NadR [Brevibacillus nitrificans]